MRTSRLFPVALVCCALAAQTAGPNDLVQRFNANLPVINKLMDDLRFVDAADKAKGLVQGQAPVFVSGDPNAIGLSLENGRGMLAVMKLQATCVHALGQWENALEINQARLDYARSLDTDLKKATALLDAQWGNVLEEGKIYTSKNEARAFEIEKNLAVLQQDIKNHNEKKITLDKKQIEELSARAKQAPKDEQDMLEIKAKIAAYGDAAKRFKQFQAWSAENRKMVDGMIKESEDGLEKSQTIIHGQQVEIEKYNIERAKKDKKFKPEGGKKWVEAVMRDKSNLTKLESTRIQAQLLNRLLVISPTDKAAQVALENLKQGRDPFFVEKNVPKSKKAPKK